MAQILPHLLTKKGIFALAVVMALVALIGVMSRDATSSGPRTQDPASILSVDSFKVQLRQDYEVTERFAGRVTARRDSELGFERSGLLAQVLVEEGTKVEEGTLIARLDTRSLDADYKAVQARLGAVQAAAEEAAARLALAKATETRQETLVKAGHVSAQRFDEARFNRQAVQAALAAANAQVDQVKADLERVQVALSLSEIRAPFAGEIIIRMIDEGTIVSPAQPVVRLLEGGPLEVRVGVPENVAALIDEETEASIEVGELLLSARFDRLVGAVNPSTRTQTVIYQVDAPITVSPGELAKLQLTHVLEAKGFWMPTEALAESQRGLWSAYALKPEGAAFVLERRPVELLHIETDRAFVRGTLEEGDVVVSSGLHRLVPGQLVRVRAGSKG